MVQTADIYELAGQLYSQFKRIHRDNDNKDIVVLKDRESELGSLASDLVYEVHGGTMPSDSLYEIVQELLETIADYETDDPSELDLEGDTYTSDLMAWMNDGNDHLVSDAIRVYQSDDLDLDDYIRAAQVDQKYEIAQQVIDFLNENWEEPEDEEEPED